MIRRCDPIVLSGYYMEPDHNAFTIRLKAHAIPRRLKKALTKFAAGKPVTARERLMLNRGVTVHPTQCIVLS